MIILLHLNSPLNLYPLKIVFVFILVVFFPFVFVGLKLICILSVSYIVFFKAEIENLKSKYTLMENESIATINKLQFQIAELKMQLKQQSNFSSNIGSAFSYHLWKATQIPAIVDMVLQKVIYASV